ncbi:MAG: T9SS type A sorting domain-containing protein, partial [Bacteroidetes bacterium]|nr:T9SS type A sorting domain-containing protein [Bacteroidota bacterium]
DYTGTNLSSVSLLRKRVQAIQTFYNNQNYNCRLATVGITSNSEQKIDFSLYPNPSAGEFYVSVNVPDSDFIIEVYSLLGQMVYSKKLVTGITTINMEQVDGPYIYIIKSSKGEVMGRGKLIKR